MIKLKDEKTRGIYNKTYKDRPTREKQGLRKIRVIFYRLSSDICVLRGCLHLTSFYRFLLYERYVCKHLKVDSEPI